MDETRSALELADWRRRVATLYAEIRERAGTDPVAAWDHWRAVREAMYREHSQSPVPAADRLAFRARHWPYDAGLRFEVEVSVGAESGAHGSPTADGSRPILPMSTGSELDFSRVGRVTIPFPAGPRNLDLFWMAGYAGGLFLPFQDATNGSETYGAGRYLLDTAKGADLGTTGSADVGTTESADATSAGDGATPARSRLILDFNFAFQPSCAFDPRWACPLAPPSNRLDIPIRAGERIA